MSRLSIVVVTVFALFSCQKVEKNRTKEVKLDIEYLASEELEGRETGTEGERLAAAYIEKRMKEIGLTGKGEEGFFQTFDFTPKVNPHEEKEDTTAKTITVTNVIGLIDNGADKTIIIGAHYDHLGHGISGSLHPEKAIKR